MWSTDDEKLEKRPHRYYFAATVPEFKKYLGWKRHLTKLQA